MPAGPAQCPGPGWRGIRQDLRAARGPHSKSVREWPSAPPSLLYQTMTKRAHIGPRAVDSRCARCRSHMSVDGVVPARSLETYGRSGPCGQRDGEQAIGRRRGALGVSAPIAIESSPRRIVDESKDCVAGGPRSSTIKCRSIAICSTRDGFACVRSPLGISGA